MELQVKNPVTGQSFGLNDDLEDTNLPFEALDDDALVALPVAGDDSAPNDGVTPSDVFSEDTAKRELPTMDSEFVVLDTRLNKALDINDIASSIRSTQTMSQEQAEIIEQHAPGFINEELPVGMYTKDPSKTLAEDTIVKLSERLDKEVVEIQEALVQLNAVISKSATVVTDEVNLAILEVAHKGSMAIAAISETLQSNIGLRLGPGSKRLNSIFEESVMHLRPTSYGIEMPELSESGGHLFKRFLSSIVDNNGGLISIDSKTVISLTDDGSDTIIDQGNVEDLDRAEKVTIPVMMAKVYNDNGSKALQEVGTIIQICVDKAKYTLDAMNEKLVSNSEQPVEGRIREMLEALSYLNSLNSYIRAAHSQTHSFVRLSNDLCSFLCQLAEKVKGIVE